MLNYFVSLQLCNCHLTHIGAGRAVHGLLLNYNDDGYFVISELEAACSDSDLPHLHVSALQRGLDVISAGPRAVQAEDFPLH